MSTRAQPVPHRWIVWLLIGLVGLVAAVGIDRAFFSGQPRYAWPPEPCVFDGIEARCGTFFVPESHAKPDGRTIRLNVVALPARMKPVETDAVAYLAGGPGIAGD